MVGVEEASRGNSGALHEVLGEALAPFELSGGLSGSKDEEPVLLEQVDYAIHEWRFRADDGEIRVNLAGRIEIRLWGGGLEG